jgi:hypothetical protein
MLKRHKVAMLATNQKANVGDYIIIRYNNVIHLVSYSKGLATNNQQHLYILSDDPIQDGDWFVKMRSFNNKPSLYKEDKKAFMNSEWLNSGDVNDCFKVIASTDTQLGLPQPSKAFIQKYVELYNKGQQITEIDVEYEYVEQECNSSTNWIDCDSNGTDFYKCTVCGNVGASDICIETVREGYLPKVDNNNTITIRKVKDSYSREEVVNFAIKAFYAGYNHHLGAQYLEGKEWVNENL